MPELILSSAGTPVLRCPLHGQSVSVGRSAVNDVALPDDDAPPFLCSFEPRVGGGYELVDRRGQDVAPRPLHDGDEVPLGRLLARYVARAEGEERPTTGGQRTGILKTKADGTLARVDLKLRLPAEAGGGLVEIPPDGLRIGANADNDVVVDDGFVSSFHAQLFLRGERVLVRDMDSTNGTFVDGVRIVEAEVRPSSTLRFGRVEAKFEAKETEEKVAPAGKGPWKCCDLVTADAKFAQVFALIEKVAPHDATTCVFGETGTGKELVAHALHVLSGRRGAPFVALNCASIPQNLLESELFGHEKGAFTGADRMRKGAFEEAHGGTLFLDEIGEVPLDAQAKLLRVLETRSVRRLGGRGDLPVDVRVVAATHRDLAAHVRAGKFREDLLHRLYVIPIRLPPLRERPADVVHLAKHFAEKLAPKGAKPLLQAEAEKKLRAHPFPGNVRELKNVIQRALIMGDGKTIRADDVEFVPPTLDDVASAASVYRPGMTMDDIEREAMRAALAAYGSASEAARALGVPKTTFWRRATSLGLLDKDAKP